MSNLAEFSSVGTQLQYACERLLYIKPLLIP